MFNGDSMISKKKKEKIILSTHRSTANRTHAMDDKFRFIFFGASTPSPSDAINSEHWNRTGIQFAKTAALQKTSTIIGQLERVDSLIVNRFANHCHFRFIFRSDGLVKAAGQQQVGTLPFTQFGERSVHDILAGIHQIRYDSRIDRNFRQQIRLEFIVFFHTVSWNRRRVYIRWSVDISNPLQENILFVGILQMTSGLPLRRGFVCVKNFDVFHLLPGFVRNVEFSTLFAVWLFD